MHLRSNLICMYLLYKSVCVPRREWVRSIFQERDTYSAHAALFPSLRQKYPELFFNYTRMTGEQYDHLLHLLQDKLQKQETRFRKSISASERLAICLRFLASGTNYTDLAYTFRVSKSSVSHIIRETCDVIWQVLQPLVMAIPASSDEWAVIAEGFEYKWNFPNCVGAIDGKHIRIQAPPSAGINIL
ncbi:uncharacterized protein LOC118181308 [Stegodyphus dumicola]|nr:uncharacterized protein LOC118181308 [Stegodyphus dumicola]